MLRQLARVLTAGLLCALASCATEQEQSTKNTARTFSTVVVDAGHGGRDSGAVRRSGPPEKIVALDVAMRLDRKLRESQLSTVLTRSNDVFVPLDDRVAIENAQPNSIFVSIHFNDSRRRGIQGFETYYYSPVASGLAQRIQDKLLTMPHAVNRGVHPANFRVLRKATYPAVLVECGFLSNRSEGKSARSSDYRDQLADKIAEAIVEERYGPGVYQGLAQTAAQQPATVPPNTVPPLGNGLSPGLINRF
jgi:N-acetylmuramoyl-L-alanine amidase